MTPHVPVLFGFLAFLSLGLPAYAEVPPEHTFRQAQERVSACPDEGLGVVIERRLITIDQRDTEQRVLEGPEEGWREVDRHCLSREDQAKLQQARPLQEGERVRTGKGAAGKHLPPASQADTKGDTL